MHECGSRRGLGFRRCGVWCLEYGYNGMAASEVDMCSGGSVVPVLPSDFNGTELSGHGDSMTAE